MFGVLMYISLSAIAKALGEARKRDILGYMMEQIGDQVLKQKICEKESSIDCEEELAYKRDILNWLGEEAFKFFDISGLERLLSDTHDIDKIHFQEENPIYVLPHCDPGTSQKQNIPNSAYPGGIISRDGGFSLAKWLMELSMKSKSVVPPLMASMVTDQVIGIVSTIAAAIADIVPPKIPPPVWINRPLPCMPMVTGKNCLGSVLYPITMPDFIEAHVTDKAMDGHIASFPQKYASKVGMTSDTVYKICASAYLGLQCAHLYPMCFLVIGMAASSAFPPCLPQCILTLLACPGFGIEDIKPACAKTSLPPFCGFAVFINHSLIPPQYITYEAANPFPNKCPNFDLDIEVPTSPANASPENQPDDVGEDMSPVIIPSTIYDRPVKITPQCDCDVYCDRPDSSPQCKHKCKCCVIAVPDINMDKSMNPARMVEVLKVTSCNNEPTMGHSIPIDVYRRSNQKRPSNRSELIA